MLSRMMILAVVMIGFVGTAKAQCANGRCPVPVRYTQPVYRAQAPMAYQARPAYQATATQATYGDPLAAVNAIRARYGLRALAYDARLASHAAVNNSLQRVRGLGHHHNPNAYQVAASTADPNYAANLWLNSPAHRQIILDPSLRVAGVAFGDGHATLNATR